MPIQRLNRYSVNTRTHRRLANCERIVRLVRLIFGKKLDVLHRDYRDASQANTGRRSRTTTTPPSLWAPPWGPLQEPRERFRPRNLETPCNRSVGRQGASLENVLGQINTSDRDAHLCRYPCWESPRELYPHLPKQLGEAVPISSLQGRNDLMRLFYPWSVASK